MSRLRKSLELKRLDHQVFSDRMEHTMKSKFISFVILMDVAISAAAIWLEGFKDHLIAAWPKPLGIKIRVSMRFEDQFARRIEFACNDDLLLIRFRDNSKFIFRGSGHVISPFSFACSFAFSFALAFPV